MQKANSVDYRLYKACQVCHMITSLWQICACQSRLVPFWYCMSEHLELLIANFIDFRPKLQQKNSE